MENQIGLEEPGFIEIKELIETIRKNPDVEEVRLVMLGNMLNYSRIDIKTKHRDLVFNRNLLNQITRVEWRMVDKTKSSWCIDLEVNKEFDEADEGIIINV